MPIVMTHDHTKKRHDLRILQDGEGSSKSRQAAAELEHVVVRGSKSSPNITWMVVNHSQDHHLMFGEHPQDPSQPRVDTEMGEVPGMIAASRTNAIPGPMMEIRSGGQFVGDQDMLHVCEM